MDLSTSIDLVHIDNKTVDAEIVKKPAQAVKEDIQNGGMYLLNSTFSYWGSDAVEQDVKMHHAKGEGCFIQILIDQSPAPIQPDHVIRQPLKVLECTVETDFAKFSALADSPRLFAYRNYDKKKSIAVLIWGRDPPASFVSLLMQPWVPLEEKIKAVSASSNATLFTHSCSQCGVAGRVQKCPCGNAFYCDQKCQKQHWSAHKQTCTVAKK